MNDAPSSSTQDKAKMSISPKKLLARVAVSVLSYSLAGPAGAILSQILSGPAIEIFEHLGGHETIADVFKDITEETVNITLNKQKTHPANDELKRGVVLALKKAIQKIKTIVIQEIGSEDRHLDEVFDFWIQQLTDPAPQGTVLRTLFASDNANTLDWIDPSHLAPSTEAVQTPDLLDIPSSDVYWHQLFERTFAVWHKSGQDASCLHTIQTDYKKIMLKHLPTTFQICFAEVLNDEQHKTLWTAFEKGFLVETRQMLKQIQRNQGRANQQLTAYLDTIDRKLTDIIAVPALLAQYTTTIQLALAHSNETQDFVLTAISEQNAMLSRVLHFVEKLKKDVHGNFFMDAHHGVYPPVSATHGNATRKALQFYSNKLFVSREVLNSSLAHCLRANKKGYFLLSSPSGSGKSAALAKWILKLENLPDYTVFYRFYSRQHGTQYFYDGIASIVDQLLKKLCIHGGRIQVTERDLLREAFGQMLTIPHLGWLVVVLDGLDESDPPLMPGFLPDLEELADRTYVICSHRNTEGTYTLRTCRTRWNLPTLEEVPGLEDFTVEEIGSLFRAYAHKTGNPHLERLISNHDFVVRVHKQTHGLAIYVKMLAEELSTASTMRQITAVIEDLPDSFDKYVQSAIKEMRPGSIDSQVFSLLSVSKGPLLDEELATITHTMNMKVYLRSMPSALLRWLLIDNREYSFQHDSIARAFRHNLLFRTDELIYQTQLLNFCSQWSSNGHPYPLRHYADHLKEAIHQSDGAALVRQLYALAENDAYLQTQRDALSHEAYTSLSTIMSALDVSIERKDVFKGL